MLRRISVTAVITAFSSSSRDLDAFLSPSGEAGPAKRRPGEGDGVAVIFPSLAVIHRNLPLEGRSNLDERSEDGFGRGECRKRQHPLPKLVVGFASSKLRPPLKGEVKRKPRVRCAQVHCPQAIAWRIADE
jgi:hypothetical protein